MNPLLYGLEARGAEAAQPCAGGRRADGAIHLAGEGRGQGRLAGRHALRGPGLPLRRPRRRPQHPPTAKVSGHGAARSKVRCCCTLLPKRDMASNRRPTTRPPSTPPSPSRAKNGSSVAMKGAAAVAIRKSSANSLAQILKRSRVAVITAAMCQGHDARADPRGFPDHFFDVGICESHAVAFAAGLAKTGLRPMVTSTAPSCSGATTRSSRKSPCRTCRYAVAWIAPAWSGPTARRITASSISPICGRCRIWSSWRPATKHDLAPMIEWRSNCDGPDGHSLSQGRRPSPCRASRRRIELGKAEVFRGAATACSSPAARCAGVLQAADRLAEEGLDSASSTPVRQAVR